MSLRRAFIVSVVVLCASGVVCAQDAVPAVALPNPHLFPGATNPNITPENISENICKRGWTTKSIRPPASYTPALKRVQLKSLRYTRPNPASPRFGATARVCEGTGAHAAPDGLRGVLVPEATGNR